MPDGEMGPSSAADVQLVLAAQASAGADRERLVKLYTPRIAGIARTYAGVGNVDRRELMQDGVVGLLRALQRYEPDVGTSFWGYASWWVRQAMQHLVAEMTRPIVLSDRALRQLARIRSAEGRLAQKHAHQPSLGDLADATGFAVGHIQALTAAARRPRGLEERIGGEDGAAVGDRVLDVRAEDAYDAVPWRAACRELPELMAGLSDQERAILCSRFGLGERTHTLRELGDAIGVSAERVRQIEEVSLQKCRDVAARTMAVQQVAAQPAGSSRAPVSRSV
jgi:RNA polymerase sigma factor (sigma-70 family)